MNMLKLQLRWFQVKNRCPLFRVKLFCEDMRTVSEIIGRIGEYLLLEDCSLVDIYSFSRLILLKQIIIQTHLDTALLKIWIIHLIMHD